jgi:hypothetical protein
MSKVKWLTSVTRSWLLSGRRGGVDSSTFEMNSGDGSGRLVNFRRRTSRNPRA